MKDIIIIGAGPVGLYAGHLSSLHNLNGLIIESLSFVGGQLTSLYPEKEIIDLPGFASIKAKDYIDILYTQQQNHKNPLPVHLNETVLDIIKENDSYLVKTNISTYQTKTILLCTGMGVFSPRKIGLENEDSFNNIIYALNDTSICKDKDIVILGGGDSAIDWAITLSDIAKSVSIVHRRDEFRGQSSNVEKMINKGVKVYKPYNVISLSGDRSVNKITLSNVSTNEITSISADMVFVNYGMNISSKTFGLENKNNNIIVDSKYMSSKENIFAIGNICYYDGKVKNITSGLGEAVIAITKIDQIINPSKNIPVHF